MRTWKVVAAMSFGSVYGIIVSWICNSTLYEIATNYFFSFYFGIFFIGLGAVIAWRIISTAGVTSNTFARKVLLLFSLMVILSGIICFIVDHNSFHLSTAKRIPMFTLLGTTICFTVTFAYLDVLNMILNYYGSKSIVETQSQIFILVGFSLLLGAIYGFIFGALDIEDSRNSFVALMKDEQYRFPIAVLVGAVSGLANLQATPSDIYADHSGPPSRQFDDGL